jgi:hypothetical protein
MHSTSYVGVGHIAIQLLLKSAMQYAGAAHLIVPDTALQGPIHLHYSSLPVNIRKLSSLQISKLKLKLTFKTIC